MVPSLNPPSVSSKNLWDMDSFAKGGREAVRQPHNSLPLAEDPVPFGRGRGRARGGETSCRTGSRGGFEYPVSEADKKPLTLYKKKAVLDINEIFGNFILQALSNGLKRGVRANWIAFHKRR